jgi:hypothetical protein
MRNPALRCAISNLAFWTLKRVLILHIQAVAFDEMFFTGESPQVLSECSNHHQQCGLFHLRLRGTA